MWLPNANCAWQHDTITNASKLEHNYNTQNKQKKMPLTTNTVSVKTYYSND